MKRRYFVQSLLAGTGAFALSPYALGSEGNKAIHTKPIPASGERLPVIGMGTWITFNIGPLPNLMKERTEILRVFFEKGGGMIDSSPMYGSAEKVVGECLRELNYPRGLFSATKVWTASTTEGSEQIEDSLALWGVPRLDLEQVHNLVNWQAHLKRLRKLKDEGTIRYLGITTSHGRRHSDLEQIMREVPLDFVQLTYNITHREVEQRLLPLAQDKGIAVIANRPYDGGSLPMRLQGREKLPPWAEEVGATNWPDFLLKYIVSHPAITCAIPATSKTEHMRENMAAGTGILPDATQRERMAAYVASL